MKRKFGYAKKLKHYDAHVTFDHISARNIQEAKRKAIKTLKVRKS